MILNSPRFSEVGVLLWGDPPNTALLAQDERRFSRWHHAGASPRAPGPSSALTLVSVFCRPQAGSQLTSLGLLLSRTTPLCMLDSNPRWFITAPWAWLMKQCPKINTIHEIKSEESSQCIRRYRKKTLYKCPNDILNPPYPHTTSGWLAPIYHQCWSISTMKTEARGQKSHFYSGVEKKVKQTLILRNTNKF